MKKKHTLFGFITDNKAMLLLFIISTIVVSVAAPYKSYLMQWLIDSTSKEEAVKYLLYGIVIVGISHLSEYACRKSYCKIATSSIAQIRERVFISNFNRYINGGNSESSGDMLSLLTNDLKLIMDEYYMSIFNIAMWGGMGLVAVCMIASISPGLMVLSLVMSLMPIIVPKLMSKKMNEARKDYSKDMAKYTGKADELIKGFEALMTSNGKKYYCDSHQIVSRSAYESEYKMRNTTNLAMIFISLATWIPSIAILVGGVFLVFEGKITIGYLITANSLTNFVIAPLRTASTAYVSLRSVSSIKKKVEEAMNREVKSTGTKPTGNIASISVKDLTYTYPDTTTPALNHITYSIRKGGKVALVGPSGCGKSTMLKLLFNYFDSYTGNIQIGSDELRDLTRDSYYQRVTMIPQKPYVFTDTIYNNICLYQQYSEEEINKAIDRAGLRECVSSQPEGLQTLLTEGGNNLSGGQIQRIALARALLQRSELILVDEATASLDVEITRAIMNRILDLDCTVVVVTHDVFGDYMERFDEIIYLEDGNIKEQGSFKQLMKLDGRFAKMYEGVAV